MDIPRHLIDNSALRKRQERYKSRYKAKNNKAANSLSRTDKISMQMQPSVIIDCQNISIHSERLCRHGALWLMWGREAAFNSYPSVPVQMEVSMSECPHSAATVRVENATNLALIPLRINMASSPAGPRGQSDGLARWPGVSLTKWDSK